MRPSHPLGRQHIRPSIGRLRESHVTFRSVQDRWFVTDPVTGKRVPSARHGQEMRYRARFKDAAGNEITQAFADKESQRPSGGSTR